jgi:uncharacterized damage-inducible protein DinB
VSGLDYIRRVFDHLTWADATMAAAVEAIESPDAAVCELAHVFGAEENWLARLEERAATLTIWPDLSREALGPAMRKIQAGYAGYLGALRDEDLTRLVAYTNSQGRSFETAISDILLHVVLHSQYHRGKVNLLLRQSNATPAPVDFIGFVRGVPAARTLT